MMPFSKILVMAPLTSDQNHANQFSHFKHNYLLSHQKSEIEEGGSPNLDDAKKVLHTNQLSNEHFLLYSLNPRRSLWSRHR